MVTGSIGFCEVTIMENLQLPHKLTLNERKHLTATGVTQVIRCDEDAVELATTLGTLEVRGEGLSLKGLSLEGGQATVSGHIFSLHYEEPRSPGFWHRLRL